MSKQIADQNAEAAPATYKDFLALSATSPTQSPVEEKAAPASEPETPQEPKGLTDDEKAERKRRNDERRAQRWYEERGEMRAQLKSLQEELAQLKANRTPGQTPAKPQGVKTLQDFLNSGEHKTYEAAQEAYMDYKIEQVRGQIRQEEELKTSTRETETVLSAFDKARKDFASQHSDFDDAYEACTEALDGPNGEPTPVTTFLVKSKDMALIHHLGNNPDLLENIAGLPHDEAIAELGALRKELKASPVPETVDKPVLPKAPRNLGARGTVPRTPEDVMRKAAEQAVTSGDPKAGFKEFRAASQAKRAAATK